MKYKVIEKCDECRKAYKDMKLKSQFFCYGKKVCNDCYLKTIITDAE